MEALLGRHVDLRAVRKIGEGTFGEAFKVRGCTAPALTTFAVTASHPTVCWFHLVSIPSHIE
jgi:hypothetical protein